MRVVPFFLFLLAIVAQTISAKATHTQQFEILMQALADGWNQGNAQKAADCFTENAVYSEPPDKQLYRGRAALFKFFGGNEGRKRNQSACAGRPSIRRCADA